MKQGKEQHRPFLVTAGDKRRADEAEGEGWSAAAQEARFYSRLGGGSVRCELCPRCCVVTEGRRGVCRMRENREGTLYTLVHSLVSAANVDAIEKKPLFHFLPGTKAFSIGTVGCNLHCKHCQNWDIAQARPEQSATSWMPPEEVVRLAQEFGCPTIAYTYNEPTIFAEFMMDTAEVAREAGLRNIAVSNGYVRREALVEVYGQMDAVKIDVKAFTDKFYREIAGGALRPVLDNLVTLRGMGKWVEIVYLVIPTLNDSEDELRRLAKWIKENLGEDVPLHFTRFHPEYELRELPPTPVATLDRAKEIADAEGLRYVYVGNVAGHDAQDTYCPGCKKLLVERTGFMVTRMRIGPDGACPYCKRAVAGVWHG